MCDYSCAIGSGTFMGALRLERQESQPEGVGGFTEMDVQAKLAKRLEADFRPYRLLAACNPPFVCRVLQPERRIGTLLSCTVVVPPIHAGVEIAAADPVVSMAALDHPEFMMVAEQVRENRQAAVRRGEAAPHRSPG